MVKEIFLVIGIYEFGLIYFSTIFPLLIFCMPIKIQEAEGVDKPGPKRKVPLFAEFIMVLTRLRLGLLIRHLADIYSISEGTVSKIYTTWICLLYHVLNSLLIVWPTRKQVQRYLPKSFSKFPTTRIIIDCTEIKVQKPTGPSAQKVTWSDYKSSNTFKLLVGFPPQVHSLLFQNFGLVGFQTEILPLNQDWLTSLNRMMTAWQIEVST